MVESSAIINMLQVKSMMYTNERKTASLFDPKGRKLMEKSWAGLFEKEILSELPPHKRAPFFTILVKSIHTFLVNVQHKHKETFESLETDLVDTYLPKKALSCFSMALRF
jgi:hypothetical protein